MTTYISNLNRSIFPRILPFLLTLLCVFTAVVPTRAQTRDLTAVVLVDSSNAAGFNTSPTSPGSYQQGPELYLKHLQIPYRLVDVSQVAAQDLTSVQLIITGHAHVGLSDAWQTAITTAVSGGTGFVNLDNDLGIGAQTHIRAIFHTTGATTGDDQTTIVIPANVQVGGAKAHYIAALQKHWIGDPAGDITYKYHGTDVLVPSNATLLTGSNGTVVAELGTDPLIIATTYGQGRAVDFTSCDYMHNDRFGFAQGVDDLFWRSLVWAARKPFALRGYPHIAAIQMDDNEPGIMSRIPDLWNTAYTGTTAADGTGGPWKLQLNMQLSALADPGGERAQMISAIKAGNMHATPHGLDYGSGGDLYWNLTVPNTDSQWLANVASTLSWQQGQGGTDTFPPFGRSMVAHYWDISPNSGFEMFNSFGERYITTAFEPNTYYFTDPKTDAQRLPLGPFRTYVQTPEYSGDYEETFPYFYADDITVGSVNGKPAQTFFAFGSVIGLSSGRFFRNDATFPSSQNGMSLAESLNQWEYYMWHFWSGMEPAQVYTHDGDNLQYATVAQRQAFITQFSQWFSANSGQHVFMDGMGDYLRATKHSLLAQGSVSPTTISLTFTGSATDADGNLIPTQTHIFYGDDEGTLFNIPGFSNGGTYSFPFTPPPNMTVQPTSLSYTTTAGSSPAPQSVTIGTSGGNFTWTASSDSTWLTATPSTGAQGIATSVKVNSTGLVAGTYNGILTFTSPGTGNGPQTVAVSLLVKPIPALVPSPTSLAFTYVLGAAAPASQSIALTNPAGTSISWTVSDNASWLSAVTGTAGTPGSVTASVSTTGLIAGTYNGTITITPAPGTAATITVPVSLKITAPVPTFTATPTTLAFTAQPGGAAAATQSISLASTPTSVTWKATSNVTWLKLTPATGTSTPATFTVAATALSLAAGTYNGVITITPTPVTGGVKTVAVSFVVSSVTPTKLALSPTLVHMFGAAGTSPGATVNVINNGSGTMAWSASSNASWLLPSPTSSPTPGPLTLSTNTAALVPGNFTGAITVTAPGATGSPTSLPVTLHLGAQAFTDTFASGSAQWTPSPLGLANNWSVVNNTFHYNGGGHTQQYAGSSAWTNYIVSADIQLPSVANYPGGLRGRVNTTTGVSYAVWLYPADHVIKLFRTAAWNIDTSGLALLGTSPTVLFDTQTHTVRLAFSGSQIQVFYDNTLMITATDTALTSGAIALDVSSQPINFSNVVVLQQ